MTHKRNKNHYRGALLGLACGDALGTTLEFKSPGTFSPLTDMVGGGPFNLQVGQWTDDTSLALCLAESLVTQGQFDPTDQMRRYVRWYREGHLSSTGVCFDIGNTTRAALEQFESTGEPYSGSPDAHAAGNGSIMRLAPVPLAFATDPKRAMMLAADSSRTTHGAAACIDACRYLAGLIVGALNGVSKDGLLASRYTPVEGYWEAQPLVAEIDEVAAGSFKERMPPALTNAIDSLPDSRLRHDDVIAGTGYVVKSLEAALWAFYRSDSFAEGCLLAVNLGDDADTTGAVYGQLAGAYYGEAAIPQAWRNPLSKRALMEHLADNLLKLGVGT